MSCAHNKCLSMSESNFMHTEKQCLFSSSVNVRGSIPLQYYNFSTNKKPGNKLGQRHSLPQKAQTQNQDCCSDKAENSAHDGVLHTAASAQMSKIISQGYARPRKIQRDTGPHMRCRPRCWHKWTHWRSYIGWRPEVSLELGRR